MLPPSLALLTLSVAQLELLATKIKADAEAKALLRIVNRLTAEKEYTVKTLVQKCVAAPRCILVSVRVTLRARAGTMPSSSRWCARPIPYERSSSGSSDT